MSIEILEFGEQILGSVPNGIAKTPVLVREAAYDTLPGGIPSDQTVLTVGAAATVVMSTANVSGQNYKYKLRNISTGGQAIRIGSSLDITFTPPEGGDLIYPGEETEWLPMGSLNLYAIASAAGGQLNRTIMRTSA